jgi:hypothetical protein
MLPPSMTCSRTTHGRWHPSLLELCARAPPPSQFFFSRRCLNTKTGFLRSVLPPSMTCSRTTHGRWHPSLLELCARAPPPSQFFFSRRCLNTKTGFLRSERGVRDRPRRFLRSERGVRDRPKVHFPAARSPISPTRGPQHSGCWGPSSRLIGRLLPRRSRD